MSKRGTFLEYVRVKTTSTVTWITYTAVTE